LDRCATLLISIRLYLRLQEGRQGPDQTFGVLFFDEMPTRKRLSGDDFSIAAPHGHNIEKLAYGALSAPNRHQRLRDFSINGLSELAVDRGRSSVIFAGRMDGAWRSVATLHCQHAVSGHDGFIRRRAAKPADAGSIDANSASPTPLSKAHLPIRAD
jgi:hypothetical protein